VGRMAGSEGRQDVSATRAPRWLPLHFDEDDWLDARKRRLLAMRSEFDRRGKHRAEPRLPRPLREASAADTTEER
jgi:hypothetical protein